MASLAALALSLVPVLSDVLLVDPAGGGDFTDITAAVIAASDGDVILVRSGTYPGFAVFDKSLTITADLGAVVQSGPIVVAGVTQEKDLRVSGIEVRVPTTSAPLRVDDCTGSVHFYDCVFETTTGSGTNAAAVVNDSTQVVFRSCRLERDGGPSMQPGLRSERSAVALYECELFGSYGPPNNAVAGPGYRSSSSFLFAAGTSFTGGDGNCTCDHFYGGHGGHGIHISGTAEVHLLDCELQGGAPGAAGAGLFCVLIDIGEGGDPSLVEGDAQLSELLESTRSVELPSVVRDGDRIFARFTGRPGDQPFLVRSDTPAFAFRPGLFGVQLVSPPFGRLGPLGVIADDGALLLELPPDFLPFVEPGSPHLLQMYVVDEGGGLVAGPPDEITVTDTSLATPCESIVFVDADAPPGGDGSSWSSAFSDLQEALTYVSTLHTDVCPEQRITVWVAEGTYKPAGPNGDRAATFTLGGRTAMLGGFRGDENDADQRDPETHLTILSGDLNGDDLPGFRNFAENSYTVVMLAAYISTGADDVVAVDGFCIEGGNSNGSGNVRTRGGGMYAYGEAQITNCRFERNRSRNVGGGLYFYPILAVDPTSSWVARCSFTGNESRFGGGAWVQSSTRVIGCRFIDNAAERNGGGLYLSHFGSFGTGPSAANCLVVGNRAEMGGGVCTAWLVSLPERRMANCTIVGNSATVAAGGAFIPYAGILENVILWNNDVLGVTNQAAQVVADDPAELMLRYSCVEGWTGIPDADTEGTLGHDPFFDADFQLTSGSPCVDSGATAGVHADITDLDGDGDVAEPTPFDLDGNARLVDDPIAPNVGSGTPPVDMGAFERQPD